MTKKDIVLCGIVAVLGGVYVIYFADWFRPKVIRIEHSARTLREAWSGGGRRADQPGRQVASVTFAFHQNYRLTSVKVVPVAELETNKYAHPLWELVSKSGSSPVKGVSYDTPIAGMESASPALDTTPLEPGVQYRLLVEAGSTKGTDDFSISASGGEGR